MLGQKPPPMAGFLWEERLAGVSKTLVRLLAAVAVVVAVSIAPLTAGAETKLTDFNGEWRGSGSDRNSPLESLQPTSCQNTIRADLRRMNGEMTCDGQAGLRKVIHLAITVDGDRFAGTVTQRTTTRGGNAPPSVLNGTVSGRKTETTATFQVRWSGLLPSTTVALKLLNPSSYSMHVTSLGITMMDVTFNRTAAR